MSSTSTKDIIQQATQELLALHERDRHSHFATDADALVAPFDESIVDVRNGIVQYRTREEFRQGFTRYFKNTTYHEWDDLQPPIVQVSRDGSLGWVITRTKVHRVQVDETGSQKELEFIYAGITTYEKRDGQWVCTANVSTFEHLKT